MPEKNQPDTERSAQVRGTIENKAPKPAGLLPKNTQQLVILAVAVVMVLIMWLTGGNKRPAAAKTTVARAAAVQPPNPSTVEDFKQTIQQEQAATRRPISPENLARLQALGLADSVPLGTTPVDDMPPPSGAIIGGGTAPSPPADPVAEDKKKREYLSLFAPNVAFTYRTGVEREQFATSPVTETTSAAPQQSAAQPSDLDAQYQRALAAVTPPAAPPTPSPTPPSSPLPPQPIPSSSARPNPSASGAGAFNAYTGKRYVVFEGTALETVLIDRLNGSFAGPVDCLVTSDVYSHDREHVLIPAGTKVLGEAKKVEAVGQQRLAVYFHRLIMPDGYSVDLDQFAGLDQIGQTAVRDQVNNHYLQIFGASLAVGILGGIAEAGTGNVFTNSPLDQARADFGANLANSSVQILDRFLNVLPTVTIREGHRVKVFLSGDLLLPDYADHTIDPNL